MPPWLTYRRLGWAAAFGMVAMLALAAVVGKGLLAQPVSLMFWLCAGTLFYVGYTAQHRGHRELAQRVRQWAYERGWAYVERDDSVLADLSGVPFTSVLPGRECTAVDVVRARRAVDVDQPPGAGSDDGRRVERETVAFTYRYVRREKHGLKWWTDIHVVAVRLPAPLPRMEVRPEAGETAVVKALGAKDHHIESVEFNDTYFVEADDPRTAHAVLDARMAQRLLEPDVLRCAWTIDGPWIRMWDIGVDRLAVIDDRLSVLDTVVDHVPQHVWADARAEVRRAGA